MGLIYIHQKVRKRKKLPLTPSLIKAREEHKKFIDSIGYKKNARKHFQAFNDINYTFGREEDKTKLRTQSLFRAKNSVTSLNAGTPHDWEDLKKYQEEEKNYD